MRGSFARIPFLFKMQMAGLVLAAAVALVAGVMDGTRGTQTIAFALPAPEKTLVPWQVEREAFATRLARGFGIRLGTAREFSGWILEAAERQQLAPDLVASLVLTESSFRKDARSSVGAIGPAQVREEFWQSFCGSADLADPEENIYCGAQILSHYQDACGSVVCALQSYNVGPYKRNHVEGVRAGARYVNKIHQHRALLTNAAL